MASVSAIGDGVILLAHGPEAVEAGEGQFRARHLFDPPALRAQHLHQWEVDPRTSRTAVDLGVLVQ